ncbi:MAG: hypothetical protein LBH06_06040, partial [Rikenellaceae bacterium]|nr:hypothetical protein [Rikenellaceae bacterium]
MTLRELHDKLFSRLAPIYGDKEARAIFYRVAEELWGTSRRDMVVAPEKEVLGVCVDEETASTQTPPPDTEEVLERLAACEPLQYVTGRTTFCDVELAVSPAALIPRPETEEMVRRLAASVLASGLGGTALEALDIGTGSGAIAVSLS